MKARSIVAPLMLAGVRAALARTAGRRMPDVYTFNDRTVLITGGSRGLGLIIARLLAEEGAKVAILARTQSQLDLAAEELRARGADVLAIRGDVGDKAQAQDAVQQVIDRWGRLDMLVNNAGIIQVGPIEHMSLEDFEQAMNVHMWGPFYTIMAALPHMRRQGESRIVNISSIGGKIAVPHLAPYSVSKFALVGLSDSLRAEFAKDNIHVTTVAPGLMQTGSPVNALFKGKREREYAWFAFLDTMPFTAIDANVAARQIIEASRHKEPELTITIQARLAVLASTLFPGLFAKSMAIYARLLPGPAGKQGDANKTGWESRSSLSEMPILQPLYENAEANNEQLAVK
ncbi:MAG: SDR family oxidoreductase [Chloroflexota bacterium]